MKTNIFVIIICLLAAIFIFLLTGCTGWDNYPVGYSPTFVAQPVPVYYTDPYASRTRAHYYNRSSLGTAMNPVHVRVDRY